MSEELKDEILADALEIAIRNQIKILKMKKVITLLCVIIACLSIICVVR